MKVLCILQLVLSLYSSLESSVLDHLKSHNHANDVPSGLKSIDYIYMINLDQRPEKFQQVVNRLKPYKIYPNRFSAVNGWELNLHEIEDLGIRLSSGIKCNTRCSWYRNSGNELERVDEDKISNPNVTYFSHHMSLGPIGIVLSHLSVLKDAFDQNYKTIWVMEDDIEPIKNPRIISELINKLDKIDPNWDILFTDRDTKNNRGQYVPCRAVAQRPDEKPYDLGFFLSKFCTASKDFSQIGMRYGAYSMVMRRSGVIKILQYYKNHQIFLPYDMEFFLDPTIKIYCVNDDVVSHHPKSLSDNGAPNYLDK